MEKAFDHPTLEMLIEAHNRELFAYLWRMLDNGQDAEDCLQETYLRAYQALPRLKPGSNSRAWIYKIATNVALTQLRKRSRVDANVVALESPRSQAEASTLVAEGPLDLVDLERAVKHLPLKQRAALMMRKYQGLSYSWIAKALDCSETAARANVYQALKRLRAQFKSESVESREA